MQMGRRPLVAMALAWVLVVSAVAAVTFVVVDRAGRGVGQASAARTVAPLRSGSASPTASSVPSTRPAPSETTQAPSEPTPSGQGSSEAGRPSATTTHSPTTQGPAAPRTESFTTQGGSVVASCTGATLRLVSITPRDGWRFEQGEREVKFTSGRAEVELHLGCVRGTPTLLED